MCEVAVNSFDDQQYERRGESGTFRIILNETEPLTDSEVESEQPKRVTILNKKFNVVPPKIIIKQSNNQCKLISPTKETYLKINNSQNKFSRDLNSFKNNVPMYLFDLRQDEYKEDTTTST